MTYQFLIVDDEYFVRQRIRLCIPWKEYGFECAGEAANVEQALHFLQTVPIDLVLLDISMPGPNGLELLRMMKEKNSQAKFIILSGFATFEYARQAIAYNVTNYLLKPINTEELIQAIAGIRETLDKNNHLKQERLAWQEARLIAEHVEKNTFFQNIFSGHALGSESAGLAEFGVIPDTPCTVVIFDGQPKITHSLSFQERSSFQQALGNLSGCLLSGKSGCVQVTDIYNHQVLIIPQTQLPFGPDHFLGRLSAAALENFSKDIVCGYGNGEDGLAAAISSAYQTALQFFTFRTVYGTESGAFHTRLPEKQALEQLNTSIRGIAGGLLKKDHQVILNSLHSVFQIIGQEQFSLPALESALSSLLSAAIEYAVHSGIELFSGSGGSAYTAAGIIYHGCSLGEIEEKFTNLFLSLPGSREMDEVPMIQRIVLQAAELIEQEYSRTDMGLQYIASVLLISPAYLSRNFKRIKQYSVMQYITKCRMEHAWDLLSGGRLSIAAAAEKTGYQDAFYFSKCFKRYFGISPSQVDR